MIAALVVTAVVTLPVLALIRHDERKAARRRHPSNFDAHWADVVDIFDDGKQLVREIEDVLRVAAEGLDRP